MDYSFFRKYESGTEIKFKILTKVNQNCSEKIKRIICEFLQNEIVMDRFYEDENDFGELYESEQYLFVVNSWHGKGITLDVYGTINITRAKIYQLNDLLSNEFKDENISRVVWKKGWSTEVSL